MEHIPGKLFDGISSVDLAAMLPCLNARKETFEKGTVIFEIDEIINDFAIITGGSVIIERDDYWGNRNIISVLYPGDVFGEAFAAVPNSRINVSVIAETTTDVLFLDFSRILTTCSNSCLFHNQMIRNLFLILAQKNQQLNEKLTHISQRSMRERILSFLTAQSRISSSDIFEISMNRQQMADYLSVDRSALSAELSRLKKEGILDFHKNSFKLLKGTP